jgi:hypothetical protein
MSYRKLTFTSQIQGMAMFTPASGEAEHGNLPSLAWPGAKQTALSDTVASRPDAYTLPAGIASMEHWLDLNA